MALPIIPLITTALGIVGQLAGQKEDRERLRRSQEGMADQVRANRVGNLYSRGKLGGSGADYAFAHQPKPRQESGLGVALQAAGGLFGGGGGGGIGGLVGSLAGGLGGGAEGGGSGGGLGEYSPGAIDSELGGARSRFGDTADAIEKLGSGIGPGSSTPDTGLYSTLEQPSLLSGNPRNNITDGITLTYDPEDKWKKGIRLY